MKRKLLLGLITLGAASMLCGFDSAETVESLSEKMNEASASMESMSADMGMNVDAAISISDGTTTTPIDLMLKADFAIDYLLDPFAMQMDGTIGICINYISQLPLHFKCNAKFLLAFPNNALLRGLSRLNLTTREFP